MPLNFNGSGPVDLGDVLDGEFIRRVNDQLVGAVVVLPDDPRLSDARTPIAHAASHVTGGNDVIATVVDGGSAGLMSGADKTKLNGVATGATANSPDATLLDRANHTGSQAESTITNLVSDLAAKEASANKGAASGYASLDGTTKIPIAQVPTGSSSSTVCIGNDARLSDARTPLTHTHGTGDITNDAITYAKIQNVTATDRLLGRVTAGAGDVEEITCTAAGRALIDDADATAQRTTLGLGTLATQNGTFSGTSSGINTGDQTISDATINTTDITTNNASATKHGFLPKLTNTGTKFLRDDGTYQTIAGGGDMLKSTYDPDDNGVIALAQLDTAVERTTNKNQASGYAGLNGSSKLTLSQMTAVMASSDLTNDSALEKVAAKNTANGYAGLDANSKLTFSAVPIVYARVTGSDATTTGQALVDITGLSVALLANAVYEFEAVLSVTTSAVTTGCQYGIQFSAAGATVVGQLIGSSTSTAAKSERIAALNTASGTYLTTSAQNGQIQLRGIITVGANAGNITVRHLKVTSGTSTVRINSFLKCSRIV